jgi:hypothetical protein
MEVTETRRGSVPRRQPRKLSADELARKEKQKAERQKPRPSSDQCVSVPVGVAIISSGGSIEIVRWRCPKDLRVMFTSLYAEKVDTDKLIEAKLFHNDEYLGSIPIREKENSAFLAFKEIHFEQFDLIRVVLYCPPDEPTPGEAIRLEETGVPTPTEVIKEIVLGPLDFILRYK